MWTILTQNFSSLNGKKTGRVLLPLPVLSVSASGRSLKKLFDQVNHPGREAGLVVVPGDHLDHVAGDHLGALGIDDGGKRAAVEVDGDDGVLGVAQDPLERAFGGSLQGRVD